MQYHTILLLLTLMSLASPLTSIAQPAPSLPQSIRILCVGDSITCPLPLEFTLA